MPTLVVVLRVAALLILAGLVLLAVGWRRGKADTRARGGGGKRAPLVANLAVCGLLLLSIPVSFGSPTGPAALPLALSGCLLALAGALLVVRSRAELGAAWSLVPRASEGAGLVTTGPYERVRHPIYLGLSLLAMGEALAFGSWPAIAIVAAGVVPSFAWRASAEEKLLGRTFGGRYEAYRLRTGMMLPRPLRR